MWKAGERVVGFVSVALVVVVLVMVWVMEWGSVGSSLLSVSRMLFVVVAVLVWMVLVSVVVVVFVGFVVLVVGSGVQFGIASVSCRLLFPLFLVFSSGLRPLPSSPPTLFLLFLPPPPGVWYGGVGCGRLRRDGMGNSRIVYGEMG